MTIRVTPMSIAVIAMFIILPFLLWTNQEFFVRWFSGAPGLLALAGLSFIGNFTILLPAPTFGVTMPLVIQLAEQNGDVLASAFYAVGAAMGEMSGYVAGRKGASIPFFGESSWHQTLERWLRSKELTDLALVILSAIPVLFPFDVGGMIAGSIRHPWWRFLLSAFLGRWFKYWLFIRTWQLVASLSGYLVWIVLSCVFIGLVVVVWKYRKKLLRERRILLMRIRTDGIHFHLERRWGW